MKKKIPVEVGFDASPVIDEVAAGVSLLLLDFASASSRLLLGFAAELVVVLVAPK